jgi:hypothetical protein
MQSDQKVLGYLQHPSHNVQHTEAARAAPRQNACVADCAYAGTHTLQEWTQNNFKLSKFSLVSCRLQHCSLWVAWQAPSYFSPVSLF